MLILQAEVIVRPLFPLKIFIVCVPLLLTEYRMKEKTAVEIKEREN